MTTPPLLAVADLVVEFPRERGRFVGARREPLRAVDGVSLELERGESLGVVGESGCGKTTTARTIVGLCRPSSGSVRLDGVELSTLTRREWLPFRRRMQMIFQDPFASLDPRQTVGSILVEPLKIHGVGKPRERKLRTLALLDAVGLEAGHLGRYPHEFSGGQRQRIGIARALALEPELIVCDEPVSALDVSIQAQIINLLGELKERFALSLLFIAHDLAVVRHVCDRVAVMYRGRVVETAEREGIFTRPRHPYTVALLSAIPVPDPELERRRERIVLQGEAVTEAEAREECGFRARCSERDRVSGERCSRERPRLRTTGTKGTHRVACFLDETSRA